jgi:transposase InsO family protein/transposase-like protein
MISRENQPHEGEYRSDRWPTDRPPRGTVPPQIRARILEEVASGRKAIDVAQEYGVHHTTITKWKREEWERGEAPGVEPPPQPAEPVEAVSAPPRETGRYSKGFKEEVLAQVNSGRKPKEVGNQYGVPTGTISRWKHEARSAGGELPEPKSTRPTSSGPSPINEEHRRLVLSLKDRHPNMGLAQIQNQLKRFEAVKLGRHMIARILKEAGIPLQKPKRPSTASDSSENRFEMTRPNELWAVDFKEFWIHSEKAYALFLLDDFSRFCVGFALTEKPTAELAIATVESAIQRYGRPERILSDRGAQFHAWNGVSRFDEFLADFLIDHSVTKAKHAFTNGKLEAFNRAVEEELLDVVEFGSLSEAEEAIRKHIQRHNFLRTHMGIDGLVPADRYFGMIEEAKQALQEGLRRLGPGLNWLKGLVSHDGPTLRSPTVLQLVVRQGKLEVAVLGQRFKLG